VKSITGLGKRGVRAGFSLEGEGRMSLISEALKKVQQDREGVEEESSANNAEGVSKPPGGFNLRRMLLILIPLVIVAIFIYLTLLTGKVSKMSTSGDLRAPLIAADPGKSKNIQEDKEPGGVEISSKVQSMKKGKMLNKLSDRKVSTAPVIKEQKKQQTIHRKLKIKKVLKPAGNQKAKQISGDDLKDLANQYLSEKRYLKAVKLFKQILKKNPSENVYLKIYTCYKRLKNDILAGFYIKEGRSDFPDSFYLNKISAINFIRKKQFSRAIENIKAAQQRGREDYSLNTYLGLSYFHRKKFDPALEQFNKSLSLNKNAIENYYYIGLIYDNRRKFNKALKYYTLFLNLNPDNKYFKHKNWIISRIRMLRTR
jgi:Tfp pilus assembly protein PilF